MKRTLETVVILGRQLYQRWTGDVVLEPAEQAEAGLQPGRGAAGRGVANIALYSLSESGFMDATYKKWFGIDAVVPIKPNPYF